MWLKWNGRPVLFSETKVDIVDWLYFSVSLLNEAPALIKFIQLRGFYTSLEWRLILNCIHLKGHGQCNCGRCDCKEGWTGKKCEHPHSCPMSVEESTKKCQGNSNLPCSGRGKHISGRIFMPFKCTSIKIIFTAVQHY